MALTLSLLTVTTLAFGPVDVVGLAGGIGDPERGWRAAPSLEARVPAPLAHLRLLGAEAGASAAVVPSDTGSPSGTGIPSNTDGLLRLFDDPALLSLWFGVAGSGSAGAARPDAGAADGASVSRSSSQRILEQLGGLSTGELEFAVVALLPRRGAADLPLMVGRIELSDAGQELVEATLDSGRFPRGRTTADVPVYRLTQDGARATGDGRVGPGELFELALVGRHLLVANHGATLDDLLRDSDDRTAAAHPESLDADPLHRAMRERVLAGEGRPASGGGSTTAAPAGSIDAVLSLDWPRLAPRLAGLRGVAERSALGGWMFDAVGLGNAQRVVIGFDVAADEGSTAAASRRGTRTEAAPAAGVRTTVLIDRSNGAAGLWSAAAPRTVRELVDELPVPALASMTVSMDADRLFRGESSNGAGDGRSEVGLPFGGDWFGLRLAGTCREFGLDFERHIRPHLGRSLACQALLLPGSETAAVLSVATRSPRDAEQLFAALCQGFDLDHHEGAERRRDRATRSARDDGEWAELPARPGTRPWIFGVAGASLVFAPDEAVMRQLRDDERGSSRAEQTRQRRAVRELAERWSEQLEGRAATAADSRLVGVLQLDGSTFATADRAAARHVGLLLVDDDHVRLEVWSTTSE